MIAEPCRRIMFRSQRPTNRVAALAVTNQENDQKQAIPMVQQLIANIQPADSENKVIALLDAGYNAGANLA